MQAMKRLQAFQFRLEPNGEQQRLMHQFAGCCRFVYNRALALQEERHAAGQPPLGYSKRCAVLKQWKADPDMVWLNAADSQILQQTLKDLGRAYTNFFEQRAEHPTFKKKGCSLESFRYPPRVQLDQGNRRVYLPKIGWVRYRNSRAVEGAIKNVTVSRRADHWMVSIQTEREVDMPLPVTTSAVGIDVGVARFATLSDGSFIAPRNRFKPHEEALRKAQQAMSRKVKFSRNWIKAKAKVQRLQARIANVRRDFLHQTSTTISQNHALVIIEDLKVSNMTASAAGTLEQPGKRVRQKAGLNKAILDQGWGTFRRQLDYKLAWNGAHLIAVPPHHTSQTCPVCGHVSAENRQTQARFACVVCGYENHADVVGAINIRARGMQQLRDEGQDTADASAGCFGTARIACEVSLVRGQQQEPTEVTIRELACA